MGVAQNKITTTRTQDMLYTTKKYLALQQLTFGSFLNVSPTFSYTGARFLQWPHPEKQENMQKNFSTV